MAVGSREMNLIARVYAALLQLYPQSFRAEFGEEMRAVFADALQEAARAGRISLARLLWRELLELPVSIAAELWRERSRRNMDVHSQEPIGFQPVSGLGILAALTPFLGAAILGAGSGLAPAGYFVVLGGMIVLLFFGLIRRIPSWSLPTLGLFATFLAFPTLALWAPVFIFLPPLAAWMRLVIGNGWPSFNLMLLCLVAIAVMSKMTRVPLYERVRRDWIWLAFALYGSAALWLWLTFDEYAGRLPYVVAAGAALVFGALVYLRANRPGVRFVILLGSLLLAILIVAWGKWNLVPTQTWPLVIDDGLRWSEIQSSLVTGAWLISSILGPPALVRLLPLQRSRSPSTPV